jgi:hypothetical protein
MTAIDPTRLACTPQLALTLAEGLLNSAAAGKGKSYAVWASYATLPLAALLYAAHQDGLGPQWVLQAAANTGRHMAPDEPGWVNAAQQVADAPLLAMAMTRAANLEARQRASLRKTVVDALAVYAPRETGEWR